MCSYLKGFFLFVSFLVSLNCYAAKPPVLADCETKLFRNGKTTEQLIKDLEEGTLHSHTVLFHLEHYGIQDQNHLIQMAKIIANRDSDLSQFIRKFGIQDQKALVEIALISAQTSTRHTAQYLKNYRIKDVNDRIQVAKVIIALDPKNFIKYLGHFNIKDPQILAELAKLTMKSLENVEQADITEVLGKFRIHLQKDLIELAEIEGQRDVSNLSVHLQLYGIQDQDALVRIAKREALKYPTYVAQHLHLYGIEDKNAIIEIVKLLARENCWGVSDKIRIYEIRDQTALVEIAKLAATQSGACIAQYIEYYDILNEKDRIAIAKIAAAAAPEYLGPSRQIQNFEIQKEADLIEIAKIAARHSGQDLAKYLSEYQIQNTDALVEIAKLAAPRAGIHILYVLGQKIPKEEYENIIALAKTESWIQQTSSQDRLYIYQNHLNWLKVPVDQATWLVQAIGHDSQLLEQLCAAYNIPYDVNRPLAHLSGILKVLQLEKYISLLSDHSQHAEVQTKLFNNALNIHFGNDLVLKNRLASNPTSIQLLEILLGVPEQGLSSWSRLSNDRKNSFYELALNIAEQRPKIFSSFPDLIPFLVKKDSLYALNLIRDILAFDSQADLSAAFAQKDEKFLVESLRNLFEERLRLAFSNPELSLNYDDFLKLQERWGDVAPIFTLLARFYGDSNWRNEIPWLGRIFSAELKDQFKEAKFQKGFDGSDQIRLDQQLSFLTAEQKAEWMKPRYRAQVVLNTDDNQINKEAYFLRALQSNLVVHLFPHSKFADEHADLNETPVLELNNPNRKFSAEEQEHHKKLKRVKEIINAHNDPRTAMQEMNKTNIDARTINQSLTMFFSIAAKMKKPERIYTELKFLNANISELVPAQDQMQIRDDLKELLGYFREQKIDQTAKTIVYTTLVQDAKSLLTIGDLVEASSCQNYRTGSVIQTLLGYVLDASVQAILSYGLSRANFKNENEFDLAVKAVEADASNIQFHPNTQKFTVQTAEGVIESSPVRKAYYRKILKLGKTKSGAPGLKLERAYQQNHAALGSMEKETDSLAEEISAVLNAQPGSITISKSRNPCGVYSDAGGGVKTEPYSIK